MPGLGRVRYDLAFGGAFYAYVQACDVGVRCTPEDFRPLIEKGMAIKRAVMAAREIVHPFEPDLGFLYGTIFIGPPQGADAHSRNVCVFAEGEVDRSPCGSGTSARLALLHQRGELARGEEYVHESIVGTRFVGRVVEEAAGGVVIEGNEEMAIKFVSRLRRVEDYNRYCFVVAGTVAKT